MKTRFLQLTRDIHFQVTSIIQDPALSPRTFDKIDVRALGRAISPLSVVFESSHASRNSPEDRKVLRCQLFNIIRGNRLARPLAHTDKKLLHLEINPTNK